jgi:hypothetical protein
MDVDFGWMADKCARLFN